MPIKYVQIEHVPIGCAEDPEKIPNLDYIAGITLALPRFGLLGLCVGHDARSG